jgi:hypothetical protein
LVWDWLGLSLDQNYLKMAADSAGGADGLAIGAIVTVLGLDYHGFIILQFHCPGRAPL